MKQLRKVIFLSFLAFCCILICSPFKVKAASYAKVIEVKLKNGQDATNEIQAALDAAAKAGTKKKQALVKIPSGEYYISKTLVISSNTYLKLEKDTYIKKNPNSKDPISHMLHAKRGTKGKYSDNARITVDGGVWDTEFYHYNDVTSGSVFMFAHTSNLKILNAVLCNSYGTHLIELGGVKNVTIKGCTLYGFEAPNDDVEKEAIQLDLCHSDTILSYGEPFDDSPCTNVTITECEIYDYSRAIGTHTMVEGIYHKNVKITNNYIHDIPDAAIYGYNYANVTIQGNTLENVGCGIQIKTDSVAKKTIVSRNKGVKAMKISKNRFKINISENTILLSKKVSDENANSGAAMGVFIYGSQKYPIKDVTISDNIITSNSSGIYLRYVGSATISNNTIERHDDAFSTDSTTFAEDAIKLQNSANATITDNVISSEGKAAFENGIALRDKSSNAVLNYNTIAKSTKSGIGVYDSSSIKSGVTNEICYSGLNGITVSDGSVSLEKTVISSSKEHGISIRNGSSISLNECKILDSGNNGINIGSDSSAVITSSEITGSVSKGINVMETGRLDITASTIGSNAGKGIDIGENTTVSIYDCTIEANGANGVFVDGNTSTVIELCKIKNNLGNALQLKKGNILVTQCEFINNCLNETDGKAVAVFSGITGTISNNTFSDPITKSELWIASGTILDPLLSTVKTAGSYGMIDAAGNTYG